MDRINVEMGGEWYIKIQSKNHADVYHLKRNELFCYEKMPTEGELVGAKMQHPKNDRNNLRARSHKA